LKILKTIATRRPTTSPFALTDISILQSRSLLLLLQAVTTLTLMVGVRLPLSTLALPRAPLLQILPQPVQHQLPKSAVALDAAIVLRHLETLHRTPLLHLAQRHVHEVRRPLRQVVENVRRIHDRALARLGLLLQESEEVVARQQIQVDRDLVQQQHGPRPQQAHAQLHAAALAVAHGVQVPAQVDVEDVYEFVAALRVVVAADGFEQFGHGDVAAHDRVQDPFEAQVGYSFEAGGEGVPAADVDRAGGRHAFAAQEAEEGCFARAICSGDLV
jgi:hypothetical protein